MLLKILKVSYIKLRKRLQYIANTYAPNQRRYAMTCMQLRQMQVNQTGTIAGVRAKGELGTRIRDMGLVPGKQIRVQGRTPRGSCRKLPICAVHHHVYMPGIRVGMEPGCGSTAFFR